MRSLILGHRGMVGSAILRQLPNAHRRIEGYLDLRVPSHAESSVYGQLGNYDVLYLCAARVGGIQRNIAEPGQMIYENLMIQCNVIEAARKAGVKLIVFLGSSCIYPAVLRDRFVIPGEPRGIREDDLMAGELEPTNEPYAIAKIAGIKMLEAYHRQYGMEYLAVMPCNLYGPGDNYDPENSHFIAGMLRRFHEAKVSGAASVTLWGTGKPRREVMHVDDCARIIVELVQKGARGLINIGPGVDDSIANWAELARTVVDYRGKIRWDDSKPDGAARKLLDVSRMRSFGVGPKIDLSEGLQSTLMDAMQKDWKR